MDLVGSVRQFSRVAYAGASRILRLSNYESLATLSVEDEHVELARAGLRFMGGTQIIANGIAPVQAIPTTTATLALYNAEIAVGRALAIQRLGFFLGSGTAAAGATLMAMVSTKPIATPPTAMATGYGIQSCSGASGLSKALWTTAVTLPTTPVQAWTQLISTQQLAAANVGQGDAVFELSGEILVPPGHVLGLAILSGAGTTPLYGVSATWAELLLDLE